jgi:translation initiation factor 1
MAPGPYKIVYRNYFDGNRFHCSVKDGNPGDGMSKERLVWSSESGGVCPDCGKRLDRCVCGEKKERPAGDGVVRIRREVKGRRGKTVTTISGLPLSEKELQGLASQLKRRCGTGGSLTEGVIIIQGDHRATLQPILEKMGYTVKLAGG